MMKEKGMIREDTLADMIVGKPLAYPWPVCVGDQLSC